MIRQKIKNVGINIAIVCATCVCIFFVSEIAIRIVSPQSEDPFLFDPLIGSRVTPGTFVSVTDGEVHYKHANAAGFVDTKRALQKPKDTMRIAVLGDSFTEAIQVDDDKDFQSVLEQNLRTQGKKVEVLNFGVRGQSTAQEYLTLKNYAEHYSPDVVVVAAFLFNDVSDNSTKLGSTSVRPFIVYEDGKETIIPPQNPAYGFPFDFLGSRSHLYRWAVKKYFTARSTIKKIFSHESVEKKETVPDLSFFDVYDVRAQKKSEWIDAWATTKKLFADIQAETSAHNTKMLVVLIPPRYEIYPANWDADLHKYAGDSADKLKSKYDLTLVRKMGAKMLDDLSISYIDLYDAFAKNAALGKKLYMPTDGHFSVDGHEIVANELQRFLNEKKLLP